MATYNLELRVNSEYKDQLRFYYKNRDKILKRSREQYQECKEKKRDYYERNKEKLRQKRRERYKKQKASKTTIELDEPNVQ